MLALTHTLEEKVPIVGQICLANSHWSSNSLGRYTLTYQRLWKDRLDRAHSSPYNLVFTKNLKTSPKILRVAFCVILIDLNQVNSFELFANTNFNLRSKCWIFLSEEYWRHYLSPGRLRRGVPWFLWCYCLLCCLLALTSAIFVITTYSRDTWDTHYLHSFSRVWLT